MPEVAREPGDLSTGLERALRERMSEAVERPLLLRRPHPAYLSSSHRWVQVTPEQDSRREKPMLAFRRKDQVTTDRVAAAIAPIGEQTHNIRDQIDVSSLAVLGRPNLASGVARPDANDRLLEVDVIPAEREQFALPHAGLQGAQAQRPEWLASKVGEESRQFVVLEVGSLLALRARPLRRRKLADRIRLRVPIEDGCLKTCAEHT
jgi:hypothetical protein